MTGCSKILKVCRSNIGYSPRVSIGHVRVTANSSLLVKEISLFEAIFKFIARVAAGAGVAAFLLWILVVALDLKHMNSGFTLP